MELTCETNAWNNFQSFTSSCILVTLYTIVLFHSLFWWLFIAFWWLRNWTWCWWWWTSTRFADFFALSMNPLFLLQLQYSTFSARFSPLSKIQWLASGLGLGFLATDRLTVSLPFVEFVQKNVFLVFVIGKMENHLGWRNKVCSGVLSPGFWSAK